MLLKETRLNHIPGVTGVVLAGGRSRRFGTNKALTAIGNTTLIERLVYTVQPLFTQLLIVTNEPEEYKFLGLPMIEDRIKGLGPLGGIYTALEAISDYYAFVMACDMPDLNVGLIRLLISMREGFDVVVPRIDKWLEPLHAVYSKQCLGPIELLIDRGARQVFQFFDQVKVRYVDLWEMQEVDPDHRAFYNINTQKDLDDFLKKCKLVIPENK
jgi:molybdenum cofactor guanylyltransferase